MPGVSQYFKMIFNQTRFVWEKISSNIISTIFLLHNKHLSNKQLTFNSGQFYLTKKNVLTMKRRLLNWFGLEWCFMKKCTGADSFIEKDGHPVWQSQQGFNHHRLLLWVEK